MKTKVAIIGAGPSGLRGIKCCISEGFEVVAFEKTSEVGGEWNSNLEVGPECHSKIYEGLVTNSTKELTEFSDFSYDENCTERFLTQEKVFQYFLKYTEVNGLRKFIKFNHKVINIRPINDDQWEILAKNLKTEEYSTTIADKVLICVGLCASWMPKIEGLKDFQGTVIHSRDYRSTKLFKDKKVLLIGSGFSALDMVIAIDKVCEQIVWINKVNEIHGKSVTLNLSSKSAIKTLSIKKFTKTGAEFEDGSFEKFDIIAFATGYDFTFPFLSVDSGISVYNKCISPLYKQCINANKTSLAIIGLPWTAATIPTYEMQVKFCFEFWTGKKTLPTREEMLIDIKKHFQKDEFDRNNHKAHYLGVKKQEIYLHDLAETGGIKPIKPVLIKVFNHIMMHSFENFHTFRDFSYEVLNDFDFTCNCMNKKDRNGIKKSQNGEIHDFKNRNESLEIN